MTIAAATLERVRDLYERGQYLQALAAGKELGPLAQWPGTEGRILAGRIAPHLGAPRLAQVLFRLAWRSAPADPQACYYYVSSLMMRRGPLAAWEAMERIGDLPAAPADLRGDWFGLRAEVLAHLRDFDRADQWIACAERTAPQEAFVWVQKSVVLEQEDRFEESLAAVRRSLEIRPWFRPAVEMCAHVLLQLSRDDEALALLRESAAHIESGLLRWRQAALELELQRYEDARETAAGIGPFLPLLEKPLTERLAAMRSDIAYLCGQYEEAAALARSVEDPYFKNLADRLAAGPVDGRRAVLPVEFIRQHHKTCAPAILVSLSRYWSKPADHVEVAEAICYGGTAAQQGRRWAEERGFAVREFRVTWESAVALVDRGVPFAITVGGSDWAHLQAVIGYDSRLHTLVVRDPSERRWCEYVADKFFEDNLPNGPRGMAMVPQEEASRLEGLDLPEAALYDLQYQAQRALERYDRGEAQRALDAMRAIDPAHRLAIETRGRLADYDVDPVTVLKCAEELLDLFPNHGTFLLTKLSCLRDLAKRNDRVVLLREICTGPKSEPIFWRRYAEELIDDAREHPVATRWLRRAIRFRCQDGDNYRLLANIVWDGESRDRAMELYRFAACLEEFDENCARVYFIAARAMHRADSAVGFLKGRFERFTNRSGWPARTLAWAYTEQGLISEAFAVLEETIRQRPDDGEFQLYAADLYARYGRHDRAAELMAGAKEKSRPTRWLRSAANLARCRGDLPAALGFWRQVLEAEPIASDAHEMAGQLLADLEGREAAVAHFRQAVARFPHNYPLRAMLIEWLKDGDPAEWEAAVRELLEVHPVDPWARRELAFTLAIQGKLEEAKIEAETGSQLDPVAPSAHLILGHIAREMGDLAEARRRYREAIRLSVDFEPAIAALVALCDTKAERCEELRFLYEQLVGQVMFGDGLLRYREHASGTLEAAELLRILREAQAARPDLWHAWSALVRQLSEMSQTDEALRVARQAVERFPLVPRLWLDLAHVCQLRADREGEIAALEQSLQISPTWGEAAQMLAEALDRAGDAPKAKEVLERAVAREPGNCVNYGYLADLLWRLGEKDAALANLKKAVRLDPGYEWAWRQLCQWAGELQRRQEAIDLARELTGSRPFDSRVWILLADVLEEPDYRKESMAALERAIALRPRGTRAYELQSYYLAQDGRFDEALAACRPAVFGDQPPWPLRARAAEIEAQRGNRDAAIEQMRQAAADNPDWPRGWLRLGDWYEEAGRYEEYLDAARQLVRIDPQRPIHLGYLAEALWRNGRRDEALDRIETAIGLDLDYEWAWRSYLDWCGETQAAARAVEFARGLTESRPSDCRVWIMLAEAHRAAGQRDECVKALQRTIEIDPRHPHGRDLLAYTLAEDRRFDEALAVCRAEVFGGEAPWPLRARAAEIEAQRGNRDGAIEQMRGVVAEAPDSARAWQRLADWYDEAGLRQECLDASRHMVESDPKRAIHWGYLADARQKTEDRAGAKEAYEKAFELDPAYVFAGSHLLDLLLEDEDLAAAEAALDRCREHVPKEFWLEYSARVAAARGNAEAAAGHLRGLCAMGVEQGPSLREVARVMAQRGWGDLADRVLDEAMNDPEVNPEAGPAWVELRARKQRWWTCRRRLDGLRDRGELWRRASVEYLTQLAQAKQFGTLQRYLRRNTAALRADAWSWCGVGRVLFDAEKYREAVRWLSDWQSRDDLTPTALFFLAVSLRELKRHAESERVSRHAIALPPDRTTNHHHLGLALEAMFAGNSADAAEHMARIDTAALNEYYQTLYGMTETMLALSDGQAAVPYAAGAARLRDRFAHAPIGVRRDRAIQHALHRCLRRLALDRRHRLLAAWHRLQARLC